MKLPARKGRGQWVVYIYVYLQNGKLSFNRTLPELLVINPLPEGEGMFI